MRSECWLGDLVSAVAWFERTGVRMTDDEVAAIARMLGREQPPGSCLPPRAADQLVDRSVLGEEHPGETAGARSGDEDGTTEPEPTAPVAMAPFRLRPSLKKRADTQALQPLRMPFDATPLGKVDIVRISKPRPYQSLLTPQSSRATLQTALQRSVPDGPPDVRRLVQLVARRDRFPAELPKTTVPTLRYGVQVLCDAAESMDPFRRDQNKLVEQLRMLLGVERTDVRWFEGSPSRGRVRAASGEWGKYPFPEPGRPVLVLSNFGLGYGTGYVEIRREWSDLVGKLRRRDCAVIALVPVPPARWPQWLARLIPLICWDRSTTVGSAAVAVRRAR